MTEDFYYTIKDKAKGEYKEKGSKFIALAFPVETVEDAMRHVESVKKEYYDARHHCYAYRIGFAGEQYRVNDDGEPSGTAGKPIYGQMLKNNLTNLIIIVVRYFGGTKLGISGLIRAYKTAAADAIANADIEKRTIKTFFEITFPYEKMNSVMHAIKEGDWEVIERDFDLECKMTLAVRQSKEKINLEKIKKINKLKIKYLEKN